MSMKAKLLVAAATFVTLVFQVQLGQAQLPLLPPFGPIPGQGPSGNPGDISKCLSSVMQAEGCLLELHKSLLSGHFGNLDPACCNAFLAIEGNCLPKLFPSNPLFPLLVKNYCAQIQSDVSATPGSGSTSPAPTPGLRIVVDGDDKE